MTSYESPYYAAWQVAQIEAMLPARRSMQELREIVAGEQRSYAELQAEARKLVTAWRWAK